MDGKVLESLGASKPKKIKAYCAQIIVGCVLQEPCFQILYFDADDKNWHVGFGSFYLSCVQQWLREEFEPGYVSLESALTNFLERAKEVESRAEKAERERKTVLERLGEFGRLFIDYVGCPRGAMGRMGAPLTEELLSMPMLTDVDGGRWRPVNEDALQEAIALLKERQG